MDMNREGLQLLLDHVRQMPDDQFIYDDFFNDDEAWAAFRRGTLAEYQAGQTAQHCGTAACLAGTACLLFNLRATPELPLEMPSGPATRYLRLDQPTTEALFFTQAGAAVRTDAILRLEHLLATGSMQGYRWDQESWYQN